MSDYPDNATLLLFFGGPLDGQSVEGASRAFLAARIELEQGYYVYRTARELLAVPDESTSSPYEDHLTERQHQVALLIAQGYTDQQIASALLVSDRRVRQLVGVIARKLGLDPARDYRVQIAVRMRPAA